MKKIPKKIIRFLANVFIAVFFLAVVANFFVANYANAATVTVNTGTTYQTIEGFGGNYTRGYDSVVTYNNNNLNVHHARIDMKLREWEPTNDNNDPNSFNWSAFQDTGKVHDIFLLMKDLKAKGSPITASVWYAPPFTQTDPTCYRNSCHLSSNYDELIESMAAFIIKARDSYGVNIEYVSFNEPEICVWECINYTEMINIIKAGGARFSSLGLNTKFLVGDNSTASRVTSYVTPVLQNSTIRSYLGPVAFHTWQALSISPSTLASIYSLAKSYNLPVWATEVGRHGSDYLLDPRPWPDWQYALDVASNYSKTIQYSGATAFDFWTYENNYPLVNSSTMTPYYAFYAVKQLADNFIPGTQMISATSDDSGVWVIAGKNSSSNIFVLQAINRSSVSKSVTFSGLPNSTLTLLRTSSSENIKTIGTHTPSGGSLTITLPASSVSTLKGAYGSGGTSVQICTSFNYSVWSTCQNNTQTRTVTSSTPSGCTGGNPILSQSCTSQFCGDNSCNNGENSSTCPADCPVSPAPPPSAPDQVYLSDLSWSSASNGWGPVEKDLSNGENGAGDGKTISLNGQTFAKGLGAHAISSIIYSLGGQYTKFTSDVGIDDEVGSNGSVTFQVYADNVKIYDSGTMTGDTPTKTLDVDVTGKDVLRLLITNGGNNNEYDHADWANARLTKGTASKTYTLTDFSNLVTDWLKSTTGSPADVNADGKVNSRDLGIMMDNWAL